MEKKRNRYPGVNFFTKADKDVFCGRTEDSKKFYTQVMLSKTLVLHAESGIGKSSLIQAGFIPLLEETQKEMLKNDPNMATYLPITVRLDALMKSKSNAGVTIDQNEIVDMLIEKIKSEVPNTSNHQLPYVEDNDQESLWRIAKKAYKERFKLMLIIDQFEELQGCAPEVIEDFKIEIAQLLSNQIPESIYANIKTNSAKIFESGTINEGIREEFNNNINFLELPLDAKVIFVVREDKLGTMSLLSDYIPEILKNDYFLKPLTKSSATAALREPALVDGDFISPQYSFASDTLVTQLINTISDTESNLVDPIQIQIVATKIERNIINKYSINPQPNNIVVTDKDIPELGDIIHEFYNNCWQSVKEKSGLNEADFDLKKKDIISVLVVNDRRDLVNTGWIVKNETKETDTLILNELLKSGLLRKVPSGVDMFYQLTHDRFIAPILEDVQLYKHYELLESQRQAIELDKQLKKERDISYSLKSLNRKIKRRNYLAVSVIGICIISLVISVILQSQLNVEKDKRDEIIKSLARVYVDLGNQKMNDKDLTVNDLKSVKLNFMKAQFVLKEIKSDPLQKEISDKIQEIDNLIKEKDSLYITEFD